MCWTFILSSIDIYLHPLFVITLKKNYTLRQFVVSFVHSILIIKKIQDDQMASKSFANAAVRYAYIHGFASSPLSTKGVQLSQWLQKDFNIALELPDLNIPSFRQQSVSRMIDHIEKKIIRKPSLIDSLHRSSIHSIVFSI